MAMSRTHFPILRVWPQDGSSGIWAPADPMSRPVAKMISYDDLALSEGLAARFSAWQARYDAEYVPEGSDDTQVRPPEEWWEGIRREQKELAWALYGEVGGRIQFDTGDQIWTVGKTKPDADFRFIWRAFFRCA